MAASSCPICAEDFQDSTGGTIWTSVPAFITSLAFGHVNATTTRRSVIPVLTKCCNNRVCNACLYHHMRSVWEEGMINSGRSLTCPLGCGAEIHDEQIQQCLHIYHNYALWNFVGSVCFALICHCRGVKRNQAISIPLDDSGMTHGSKYHASWLFWTHTEAERADLHRYEQWNKAVGLRKLSSATQFIVQYCPTPDCGYAWLTHALYRRNKQRHEAESYQWWYNNPKPEVVPDDWVRAEYLSLDHVDGVAADVSDDSNRDGRHAVCAKCRYEFCSLCRHPWKFGKYRHQGQACRSYGRKFPRSTGQDGDFWLVSEQQHAKACPGCSIRTVRISGCNHMTCPCGVEWCYVCMSPWSPIHYGCAEGNNAATVSACTIQ